MILLVTCGKEEARPAFYFDDVHAFRLRHVLVNDEKIEKNKTLLTRKNSSEIEIVR